MLNDITKFKINIISLFFFPSILFSHTSQTAMESPRNTGTIAWIHIYKSIHTSLWLHYVSMCNYKQKHKINTSHPSNYSWISFSSQKGLWSKITSWKIMHQPSMLLLPCSFFASQWAAPSLPHLLQFFFSFFCLGLSFHFQFF